LSYSFWDKRKRTSGKSSGKNRKTADLLPEEPELLFRLSLYKLDKPAQIPLCNYFMVWLLPYNSANPALILLDLPILKAHRLL
jgi:hypothetical protein